MLVATMNPCPCGYLGSAHHECTCTSTQIQNYHKKLSGPLLDRIDMLIDVAKVENSDLLKITTPTTTEHDSAKLSIAKAITAQHTRYSTSNSYNSNLASHQVSCLLHLAKDATTLLSRASDKLNLSARTYFKVIKVAQTIADLDNSPEISATHLSEALQYRKKQ
jgi:magnesium chelatase family protein